MAYQPKINKSIYRVYVGLKETAETEADLKALVYHVLAENAHIASKRINLHYQLEPNQFISGVEYIGNLDLR